MTTAAVEAEAPQAQKATDENGSQDAVLLCCKKFPDSRSLKDIQAAMAVLKQVPPCDSLKMPPSRTHGAPRFCIHLLVHTALLTGAKCMHAEHGKSDLEANSHLKCFKHPTVLPRSRAEVRTHACHRSHPAAES